MIAKPSTRALILATNCQSTKALDELAHYGGWPVMLDAAPRKLRREFALAGRPELSMFWLDEDGCATATIELVEWLRSFDPAVRRLVIGCRVSAELEIAARTAGAHAYLSTNGDIRSLVETQLADWLPARVMHAPASAPLVATTSDVATPHGIAPFSTGPP